MLFYRAYIVDQNGHFIQAINLECQTDAATVEKAKQLANGHDIELWQADRMITKLSCKSK